MNFSEIPSRKKYNEKAAERLRKQNTHAGQAKLFLSLLDFMNLTEKKCSGTPIVYIGAAPGTNIAVVAAAYPKTLFLLYDKVKFDTRLERLDNVRLMHKYVDDKEARQILAEFGSGNTRVFSDIRSLDVASRKQKGDLVGHVDLVMQDMQIQKSFTDILQPCASMFKFRLPWRTGETEWYNGTIRLQPLARHSSTETRLYVPDYTKTRKYNHKDYEERLFHFNTLMRPAADVKIARKILKESKDSKKFLKDARKAFRMPV